LDINEEQVPVLDLEKAIAAGATRAVESMPAVEALS
jgi:hypothetical protein